MILAAVIAGSFIFHLAILWESRKKIAAGYGDFIIFYTGAQIINDGRSKELFKVETQNAYQAKFDVPQLEWPLPFNHAPYELFLFMPLAHLSYPAAHAVWSGANLVLLMFMIRWFIKYSSSQYSLFVAAAILAWFPTMETLRLGQDSILSTVLLLAVFANLKRKRDGWAGFCLALGLYKPQLVLPMAGALFMARRWNGLAVFGVTGGILASVSLGMVGWSGALDFVSILRSMENYSYIIFPANMPNVRGLTYLLLHEGAYAQIYGPLTVMVSLGLYAMCLYFWRAECDVSTADFDLKFSLTIVATVLISYHLYSHDLFPLTLSLALVFRYVSSSAMRHNAITIGFFALTIILLLPVIPRYLIKYSVLSWGAVTILFLYAIVTLEMCIRGRVSHANS
jgi:hypothetical protein